ncbi:MAG: tRNA (adenosine(37)-N6)-dimethylallyltransferase MiaA [Gammaproteobacteria bacterium]|nr:tRNA (adenosine(37)-N6)-dimethylallyltransferase MiaA [Gammaproteobacteria bacterium]
MTRIAVCLMGPTASGKTEVAIGLCQRFPFEIISVDSALVYRGMDIGTAKPDAETLKHTPHRLIDIRELAEPYSAGDFVRDAGEAMQAIFAAGRIPLLVGGTMMYFRALTKGIADLPAANAQIRAQIDAEAALRSWPAMHAELGSFDPDAANRIKANDSQRIQRAIEVYRISGKPLSDWQAEAAARRPPSDTRFVKIALQPETRKILNQRIEERLNLMLNNGFLAEVKAIYKRPGMTRDTPSLRAVGYRQLLEHVVGDCSLDDARYRALVATRQLAKRQMTWLRAEDEIMRFDPLEADVLGSISHALADKLI